MHIPLKAFIFIFLFPILLTAQPTTRGLISYYKCDNNADDASTNRNDGIFVGHMTGCADRWGNNCGALYFNGTDAYISVPASQTINSISSQFTVTAWCKTEPAGSNSRIFFTLLCKGQQFSTNSNNPQYRVQFEISRKGHGGIMAINNKLVNSADMPIIPTGEWSFVALTFDGSSINWYLNGSVVYTFPLQTTLGFNPDPLDIGRDVPGGTEFYKGSLDDIRLYNRALSLNEISVIYQDTTARVEEFTLSNMNDIKIPSAKGKCGAATNIPTPELVDICGNAKLTQITGPATGSFVNAGTTRVIFAAINNTGKFKTSAYNVIVADTEKPVLQCPADIVLTALPGQTTAVVNYQEPIATDNCLHVQTRLVKGPHTGAVFAEGKTKVTYEAEDLAGNVSSCTFTVTVNGAPKILPVITCPVDILETAEDASGVKVNYVLPKAHAGDKEIATELVEGLQSGSIFPIGKTKIKYEALDEFCNHAYCSFTVTVKPHFIETRKAEVPVIKDTSNTLAILAPGTHFSDRIKIEDSLTTRSSTLTIYVFDDETEDGDTVSILLNDQLIIDRQRIRVLTGPGYKAAMKMVISLVAGKNNYLVSKAWNNGTIGDNTCEIDIYEGEIKDDKKGTRAAKSKQVILHSTPGVAGTILLKFAE